MLKVGDTAPAFTLPNQAGVPVSLKDYRGQRVILYFYPKDLTPGCTVEACDFSEAVEKLSDKNAVVLGISADTVARHAKFAEREELGFSILSDVDTSVCQKYGVWTEKALYGRRYVGIERTTFVIGPTGRIEQVFNKVRVKGHVDSVIDALPD
jgi:peroxiredoxin Q/BCP